MSGRLRRRPPDTRCTCLQQQSGHRDWFGGRRRLRLDEIGASLRVGNAPLSQMLLSNLWNSSEQCISRGVRLHAARPVVADAPCEQAWRPWHRRLARSMSAVCKLGASALQNQPWRPHGPRTSPHEWPPTLAAPHQGPGAPGHPPAWPTLYLKPCISKKLGWCCPTALSAACRADGRTTPAWASLATPSSLSLKPCYGKVCSNILPPTRQRRVLAASSQPSPSHPPRAPF